ncbi:type I-F CRISPR-associated endoribonuclease Cas6/Csy4 [Photobacterium kishitanii]|uniref:type I-F CRISPR-associated endoribonuclease Cas6/Csy4 n=1 Tax=Photobacterium kishitanii TaxID=318456 RepID=UPI00273848A1|nr:type I-F CRISPR-associated endoribonuclease Cas6/Csy4 [Photobacterium kishitanii]
MEQRYFFVIKFLPEYANPELLSGRSISVLHGFVKTNEIINNSIGISFPKWSDDSIGMAIAFISTDREYLCGLSYQPYFTYMKKEGFFDISQITEVPCEVNELRFVRNSAIDKSFLKSKNKRLKRSERRAREVKRKYIPVSREDRIFDHFHSIPMSSKGTERDFVLQIQKKTCDITRIDNQFNGYGFATNEKWLGSVPDLQKTLLF